MPGEIKDVNFGKKLEGEKEAGEDILNESIFRKKFPLTYENIKKEGRDIVKTIAVATTFSEIVISGIESPSLFMKAKEAKKQLRLGYPELEEETINQIIEKGKKIRKDLEEKYKYEKEGGPSYG